MHRTTALVLVASGALALSGCAGTRRPGAASVLDRSAFRASLASQTSVPVPRVVTRACRHGAARVRFPVLCPASWLSAGTPGPPQLRWITLKPGVYLLNAFNGTQAPPPHVFHLLIGGQRHTFGADWKAIDPGLRITTRLVRIPVRGGGTFVQQRPARRIGTTTVHGTTALVLREPPYPRGGLHGGHVIVLWNQAGHGYFTSVHGIGMTEPELVAAATSLADSMPAPSH